MNEQFAKQTEEFIQAAQDVKVPENVQAMAEENLAKTREAYSKASVVAKDAGKAFENVSETAQKSAKVLGDKIVANTVANAEAAFDAAQAIVSSKTLPEAAKLQADFIQQQVTKSSEQTKEFFELSSKLAKETMDQWNAVASKTMEQFKGA